jgi:drug/metabolite transporter (DMT)-like permease
MADSTIGVIVALGSTASWALCGVLFKKLGERLDPVGMTTVKSIAAALFLAPLLFLVGGAHAGGRDLALLAASGVIGIAIGDCFFFAALGQLSPLLLTVLLLTCPNVFSGILGVLCLGEMPSVPVWCGIALIMAAMAFLMFPVEQGEGGKSTMKGVLLGIVAFICSSVSTVIAKPVMTGEAGVSPFAVTFYRMAAGGLVLVAFALCTGKVKVWARPFGDVRYGAGFMGVTAIVAFGGFGLSMMAFKYLDVVTAGALLSLEPLFVLPFMALFGHHRVKARELAGMALAVAGVLLIALNGG